MTLFHISMAASDPEGVAQILARILGGPALPFPPCPRAWIAFSAADDGTAVEVYPADITLSPGPEMISFDPGAAPGGYVESHVALATPLSADEVIAIGAGAGWPARRCNRGPFACIELWVESRVLVEVLDPEMQRDYRSGMTARNWRAMFGMEEPT